MLTTLAYNSRIDYTLLASDITLVPLRGSERALSGTGCNEMRGNVT